jgi:putative sterol carrier protein
MSDAIAEFFDALTGAEHVQLLERVRGTLRLELDHGGQTERRLVEIDRGTVSVSGRQAKADCTIRTDRQLFEGMVGGRVNAMAALLRGQIAVEGNPNLLMQFQRLLPSPPPREAKRKRTGSTARQRS